ncbi:unnamed protein product, partial [Polarella glacialis]
QQHQQQQQQQQLRSASTQRESCPPSQESVSVLKKNNNNDNNHNDKNNSNNNNYKNTNNPPSRESVSVRSAVLRTWPSLTPEEATAHVKGGRVRQNGVLELKPTRRNVAPGSQLSLHTGGDLAAALDISQSQQHGRDAVNCHDEADQDWDERVLAPPLLVAFHKPTGCVTSMSSHDGPSVYDALRHPNNQLRAIGRLDKDTSGLLLFTTQLRWIPLLASPLSGVPKKYRCLLKEVPTAQDLLAFRRGRVTFYDVRRRAPYMGKPAEAEALGPNSVDITLTEGRNRQLRRMWAALGNEVLELKRLSFGPVHVGDLPAGSWRELTDHELGAFCKALDAAAIRKRTSTGEAETQHLVEHTAEE